jgi:hypothetical protein
LDAAEESSDPGYAWDGDELLFSILNHVRKPFASAMLQVDVSFRGKPRRHGRETKGGEYGEDRGDRGRDDVLCKSSINATSLLRTTAPPAEKRMQTGTDPQRNTPQT